MTESDHLGVASRSPSSPQRRRSRSPSPLVFKKDDTASSLASTLTSPLSSLSSPRDEGVDHAEAENMHTSNGDGTETLKSSLIALGQTLLTPLYFISFLLSLFLIDTHRHPASSDSRASTWSTNSNSPPRSPHSPQASQASQSPPSPSGRSGSGPTHQYYGYAQSHKRKQKWTWSWRRGDRKLIRRELVDAFDMRRMVLTAMICSVMLIMGAGAVSSWWLWRWGWGVGASA